MKRLFKILLAASMFAFVLLPFALACAGCGGTMPHGTVNIEGPNGPIAVSFAKVPSRGGVAVSFYHSLGQWEEFQRSGYWGVYARYIAPLKLKPGSRVLWHYPFSRYQAGYVLSQNRPESGLELVAAELEKRGIEFVIYLPKPTTGDVWAKSGTSAKLSELRRLFDCVPSSASICFDELNGASDLGWQVIEEQRKAGRRIYGEPFAMTWKQRGVSYPYIEMSDHWERFKADPSRAKSARRHALVWHETVPDGWDTGAVLLAWTKATDAEGMDWFVQAEPMVNAPVLVTFENIDPEANR